MTNLDALLANNRAWAQRVRERDPHHFSRLIASHEPKILWIGCSDSRVSPNQILDLGPGRLFVHRNVANQVPPNDLSIFATVQYAVETLRVHDIIICGHHDCGGIKGALQGAQGVQLGRIDSWLRRIVELRSRHRALLASLPDDSARVAKLCELNALQQLLNLSRLPPVPQAWHAGHDLTLHAWIYDITAGHLHDLAASVSSPDQIGPVYKTTLARLTG